MHSTRTMQHGFTLIELSIVLVIIGLIIGAVLVGQDLIRVAAIRATISQLEKYNTAVHTFQLKYNALPGDILSTQAQALGLYYVTGGGANTPSYGDGNGIIQGYTGNWTQGGTFAGEVAMFFLHLSQARLIRGMYGAGGANVTIVGATTTGGSSGFPSVSAIATNGEVGQILPPAEIGNGNYFTVASMNGTNYFVLTGIYELDLGVNVLSTNNLTPLDALAIDTKIDDGMPGSGKVFALDTAIHPASQSFGLGVSTPAANNCVNGGAYYTAPLYATIINCSLRFDFQ